MFFRKEKEEEEFVDIPLEELVADAMKEVGVLPRTVKDVVSDIEGWVDWLDDLGVGIHWIEVPRDDFFLLRHSPAFSPTHKLPGEGGGMLIGRFYGVLVISKTGTSAVVGHDARDPL